MCRPRPTATSNRNPYMQSEGCGVSGNDNDIEMDSNPAYAGVECFTDEDDVAWMQGEDVAWMHTTLSDTVCSHCVCAPLQGVLLHGEADDGSVDHNAHTTFTKCTCRSLPHMAMNILFCTFSGRGFLRGVVYSAHTGIHPSFTVCFHYHCTCSLSVLPHPK